MDIKNSSYGSTIKEEYPVGNIALFSNNSPDDHLVVVRVRDDYNYTVYHTKSLKEAEWFYKHEILPKQDGLTHMNLIVSANARKVWEEENGEWYMGS